MLLRTNGVLKQVQKKKRSSDRGCELRLEVSVTSEILVMLDPSLRLEVSLSFGV